MKGAAAPKTREAAEQARLLIEKAEKLGEAPEDPLLLFSVLYGFWVANLAAFNGPLVRNLRRSSWRSPRSNARLSQSWWGIASWVFRSRISASLPRRAPTRSGRCGYTIQLNIVRWR